MATERRRVFFSGHVQGVGFRMTTRRLAAALPLVGTVRNLDDGRVELLVEGDSTAVAVLFRAIDQAFGVTIRERDDSPESVGHPPILGFSIQ